MKKRIVRVAVEPSVAYQKLVTEFTELVEFENEEDFDKQVAALQNKVIEQGYDKVRDAVKKAKEIENEFPRR